MIRILIRDCFTKTSPGSGPKVHPFRARVPGNPFPENVNADLLTHNRIHSSFYPNSISKVKRNRYSAEVACH